MRVLLVGAGRRYEMALKFIRSGWDISSYESDINCPLNLLKVPIYQGKRWSDPGLHEELRKISIDYDLILPFQDKAVEVLSIIKSESSNDSVCVSPIKTSTICLNKIQFANTFSKYDFYPRPIHGMPAIIKPVDGFGSRGIRYTKEWKGESYSDAVVQNLIEGGREYSVDCYFDKRHRLVDFVPRERIEVVAGEVVKSCTISKDRLPFENIINQISSILKFCGPVCMQFITCRENKLWIMEINARFGGGSTLSLSSGCDMIDLLKTEYVDNDSIKNYKSNWKTNFHLSRCFVDYCYEKNSI